MDDDEGVLALLEHLLRTSGLEVTTAATGEAALASARSMRPDLAILDVNLPGLSGYEVCRALHEAHGPSLPIVFISGERTDALDRVAGLLLGADDYLAKPFAPDELLARVRALLRRAAPAVVRTSRLTAREQEVLQLLAEGRTQREIADALVISPRTAGKHIERILEKLGVRSRAQAVAVAFRDDLVAMR
ncbi:MAG: response regulator transcription factor [Pseudomonadota bacterium]